MAHALVAQVPRQAGVLQHLGRQIQGYDIVTSTMLPSAPMTASSRGITKPV